ncbi:MAG: ATP-binding cassette domain-containing protein [Anaerolineae bacterium]
MTVIYVIENLTKVYPKQTTPANKDISFEIRQGEIFGFLGDNGAGKTTLVRQMVNLWSGPSMG